MYLNHVSKDECRFEQKECGVRFTKFAFELFLVVMLVGCAVNKEQANIVGDPDLSQVKVFYVEHFKPDKRNFQNVISERISTYGYSATAGEAGDAPEDTDIVVTYKDKWMWDITNYMLELTITFRDPDSGFPLVVGESYHTSLTRLSPEEMIEEVLANMFAKMDGDQK